MINNYNNIILSKEDSSRLIEKIKSPDIESLNKRDLFLNDGAAIREISNNQGVSTVDFPDLDLTFLDKSNEMIIEEVSIDVTKYYSQFVETMMEMSEFNKIVRGFDDKEEIYIPKMKTFDYEQVSEKDAKTIVIAA